MSRPLSGLRAFLPCAEAQMLNYFLSQLYQSVVFNILAGLMFPETRKQPERVVIQQDTWSRPGRRYGLNNMPGRQKIYDQP